MSSSWRAAACGKESHSDSNLWKTFLSSVGDPGTCPHTASEQAQIHQLQKHHGGSERRGAQLCSGNLEKLCNCDIPRQFSLAFPCGFQAKLMTSCEPENNVILKQKNIQEVNLKWRW